MTVTINKTDGSVLTTIADGAVDTSSTNIALIGRQYRNYGELINENMVKMLENFANTSSPSAPIVGQLWYDKNNKSLRVYRDSGFVTIARMTSSSVEPTSAVNSDLWWDSADQQLKIFNGSSWVVIAPGYTSNQTKTGAFAQTITDSTGNTNHVAVVIYQQNQPIAIFSKDEDYVPQSAITGFTTIKKGLTISNTTGTHFNGTATNSELLDGLDSTQFLRSDVETSISAILRVLSDNGMYVGVDNDLHIKVNSTVAQIVKETAGNLQFIMGSDLAVVINDSEQLLVSSGSASVPGFGFIADPNTGVYRMSEGTIGFTANSVQSASINNEGITTANLTVDNNALINGNLEVSTNTSLLGNLSVDGDVTLGSLASNQVTINAGIIDIPNDILFTSGDVDIDLALTVNGTTTLNDTLTVYANAEVNGVTLLNGNVGVTGSMQVTGNLRVTENFVLTALPNAFVIDSAGRVLINTGIPATGYENKGDLTLGRTNHGSPYGIVDNGIYARNVPKYVATFNGTLGGLAIYRSHHVATVTRLSVGQYTLTLFDDFGDAIPLLSNNPTVIGSVNGSGTVMHATPSSAGDTSINIRTYSDAGNLTDYTSVSIAIWDGAN